MRSCILLHLFIRFMTFLVHWKIPGISYCHSCCNQLLKLVLHI